MNYVHVMTPPHTRNPFSNTDIADDVNHHLYIMYTFTYCPGDRTGIVMCCATSIISVYRALNTERPKRRRGRTRTRGANIRANQSCIQGLNIIYVNHGEKMTIS